MKKNVGKVDAVIRTLIGLGLIVYGVANKNWIGVVGLVPLLTAYFGFCPAYCPLGVSTAGKSGGGGGGCCGGGCGGDGGKGGC
ncbi:MAG: hypothetical protein JWL81_1632 [Verrucomicrobiales bacterium]|nr:hypothetical protein [Verrucomicrobiales bacterium]